MLTLIGLVGMALAGGALAAILEDHSLISGNRGGDDTDADDQDSFEQGTHDNDTLHAAPGQEVPEDGADKDAFADQSGEDELTDGGGSDPLEADGGDQVADGEGHETFVRLNEEGAEAWFDDYTPERDTIVITYTDGAEVPDFDDLEMTYDPEYDETEVALRTDDGSRPICFLPGVTPADISADMVEFISQDEAAKLLLA